MHGHPRAGIDEQVAANGAWVSDLALTHGCGPGALCPSLAELIDLVHNGAQISLTALVQGASH